MLQKMKVGKIKKFFNKLTIRMYRIRLENNIPDYYVFQLYIQDLVEIGNFEHSLILAVNYRPFSNAHNYFVS
jgi:hypothetical protein